MGGQWVETVSLKFIGMIDDDMVKNKTYCDKYNDENYESDGIYLYQEWDSYYYLGKILWLTFKKTLNGTFSLSCRVGIGI